MIAIITSFVIPFFMAYNPNYSPLSSFSNDGDKGHSNVMNELTKEFSVTQEHLDITKHSATSNKAIIIIAPQKDYTSDEIDFLSSWMNKGGHVILGGTTASLIKLSLEFTEINLILDTKIVDFSTDLGNPNYVPVSFESNRQKEFASVTPYSLEAISPSNIYLTTGNNAEEAECVKFNVNCASQHTIGYVSSVRNFAIYLDNFLIRNEFTDQFPQNLQFLDTLLDNFDTSISSIIIDESHYRWAPLNKKGVEVLYRDLKSSEFYIPVIFLFSAAIPAILALMNGIFSSQTRGKRSPITQKIRERIDRLYLERIIAVPLSIEERILIEEHLELVSRNKFYFQYVAQNYLDMITSKGLNEFISYEIIDWLQLMTREVINKQTSWEIIKIINHEVEQAIKKKSQQ